MGLSRAAPETAPERATGGGSAADEGAGEAAWRRRLAPRHREAVRRYFGGDEGDDAPGEGGRDEGGGER